LSALKTHFGASGEVLQRLASGIDDRKIEPPGAVKSISRETTFGKDILSHSLLEATLRYLSERVGSELRKQSKQSRGIILKLRYSDFTTITRSLTLKQSIDSDDAIFNAGLGLAEKALGHEKRPVRLIGIGVSNLTQPGRQLGMLDSSTERVAQLNRAVDRIRQKYGFTAIQKGRTLPLKDVFPETGKDYTLHTTSLSR